MSIYLNNGITVYEGREYRLDPGRCASGCINLISHAHSDHVPSSAGKEGVICTDITAAIIEERSGITLGRSSHDSVEALDSGHVPGASMFLIKGERTVLYTGDLCPRKKYFSEGAKPVKADVLIIESTFGKEKYVFPPTSEVVHTMKDWIDDNASKGLHSVLFAYSFGKAQELIHELQGYDIYVSTHVGRVNRVLERHGLPMPCSCLPEELKSPSVIIAPSSIRREPIFRKVTSGGVKTASVTGWAVDKGHKYAARVDEAFPLSDHSDYQELMGFVKGVSPDLVYTVHGSDKEFAKDVREKLGIEAYHLKKGLMGLSNF